MEAQKENTFKPKLAVVSVALALIIILLLAYWSGWNFTVLAIDEHNNDIKFVEVWQLDGGSYSLLANFTATGGSVRIIADQPIRFNVSVVFNDTLASSEAEAGDWTQINMTIQYAGPTYVWNNVTLNQTETWAASGGFYQVMKQGDWNDTLPVEGVSYTCTVYYWGYY